MINTRRFTINEQGGTLVFTLLIATLFTVLGLALLSLMVSNMKMTTREQDDQGAYYIAEAGIVDEMSEIKGVVLAENNAFMREYGARIREQLKKNPAADLSGFKSIFFSRVEDKILPEERKQRSYRKTNSQADISVSGSSGSYLLTSEGYHCPKEGSCDGPAENTPTRKAEKTFTVDWKITGDGEGGGNPNFPRDMAVFVENDIQLTGGASIQGGVGSNSTKANTLILDGGANISGSVYLPGGHSPNAIKKPDYIEKPNVLTGQTQTLELPSFPDIPKFKIPANETIKNNSGNKYEVIQNGNLRADNYISNGYVLKMKDSLQFNSILLNSNYTLVIDAGNEDRSIVVDHLDVTNGHIKLVGSGKLTIYVRNKITISSGSTINNSGSTDKLDIYYAGAEKLSMAGDTKIFGSLYAEKASIEMSGSGGFQGNILTGGSSVKINGGAKATSSLLFAPNADVELSGGGFVKGMIIGKNFTADGGTKVIYADHTGDLPGGQPALPEEVSPDDLITQDPVKET